MDSCALNYTATAECDNLGNTSDVTQEEPIHIKIEKEEVTEDYNTVDVAQRCNAIIDSLRATLQTVGEEQQGSSNMAIMTSAGDDCEQQTYPMDLAVHSGSSSSENDDIKPFLHSPLSQPLYNVNQELYTGAHGVVDGRHKRSNTSDQISRKSGKTHAAKKSKGAEQAERDRDSDTDDQMISPSNETLTVTKSETTETDCLLDSTHNSDAYDQMTSPSGNTPPAGKSYECYNSDTHDQLISTKSKRRAAARKGCYECYECHQTFTHSSSLARHTFIHSGIRRYTCNVCNKSFAQPGHLDIHRRIHTGEKPYACDSCGKAFIDSAHLARHKRIHVDQKQYQCNICDKGFRQRGTLKIHIRTHTGLRPFTCDVCHKGFVDSTHLTIHKRNHSGERPYVCNVCSKSFMNCSHLNRHKLIHLVDGPPTCDVCKKTFAKRTSLTVHKRIHTRNKSTAKPSTEASVMHTADPTARHNPNASKSVSSKPATKHSSSACPADPVSRNVHKHIHTSNKFTTKPDTEPPPMLAANPAASPDVQMTATPESAASASFPPGLLLRPTMMTPFPSMFPMARLPTPMFDVSEALLRLPGLSKLAQMRDTAK